MGHPTRTSVPVAAALLLGASLAGCADGPVAGVRGDRLDADRMYDLADDETASPAEVVEAGRAVDAATSGSTTLVAYTVHNDDDEGRSAAAWRLYDEDGGTVAEEHAGVTEEGPASPAVHPVEGGYLVREENGPSWLVATDGSREKVTRVKGLQPARPGDVPLGDGSTLVYRPSDRALFGVAPGARGNPQGWAVADDGSLWVQGIDWNRGKVPFRRSTDGRAWEQVAGYDPGKGRTLPSLAMTVVGEHVVVPMITTDRSERSKLVGLLVRPVAAPAGDPWRTLDVEGAKGTTWWDMVAMELDDTTVLLEDWGSPPYLVDVTDGTTTRATAPTDEEDWSFVGEQGRIYATHQEHADAWFSDDGGEGWDRLPH